MRVYTEANVSPRNISLHLSLNDHGAVVFEAFETSPAAGPTLAAKGALQWNFPGMAVAFRASDFESVTFQDNLTAFLEQASLEPVDEFAAKTRKAGVDLAEVRDTADPAIITRFLMTLLDAKGGKINPPILKKRVRDDVYWDNAELPWRRSPFWLALRVCVQRLLLLRLGAQHGRFLYKTLMCALMAQLLEDCLGNLSPESCNFLKTKLCRRLAKLEAEKQRCSVTVYNTFSKSVTAAETRCRELISLANNSFETNWRAFKAGIQRKIPPLPLSAQEEDLQFSLPNSASYLQQILTQPPVQSIHALDQETCGPERGETATEAYEAMVARYFLLTETESTIMSETREMSTINDRSRFTCVNLARQIDEYLKSAGACYHRDPEQMSVFILSLFQLWMQMDLCATTAYPVLKDFHPLFEPKLLDVLLLSRLGQMERLQEIQSYIHGRCAQAKVGAMTIFADPAPGCFADRYFEVNGADGMQVLQTKIDSDSMETRNEKEMELERVNAQYEAFTKQKAEIPCTERLNPDGTHDIRGCKHCYIVRRRWRLKIQVHEDFLPPDNMIPQRRAIVFELSTPQEFAAYRNATWNIVVTISQLNTAFAAAPQVVLADYVQLQPYNQRKSFTSLTLASHTKSFLGTHYKSQKLPAKQQKVLLPSALKFSYYDPKNGIWFKALPQNLSFAHHFAIHLPPSHPFSDLYASAVFAADGPSPSSYQAIASTPQCPSGISNQEFIAHQNLLGGTRRRWLCILTELGSSNLNLSLRDTTVLLRRLALQAGPSSDGDVLRAVHTVFRDPQFCFRLIEQVEYHVQTIAPSWRENNYMETLVILATRLCGLACPEAIARARELLLKIRNVTLTWVRLLRNEMRAAKEADVANQAARYCFLSALLCRQTFSPEACSLMKLDGESFQGFVEATLAMQEALVVDMSKFTDETRNLLVRDIKMVAALRTELRELAIKYFSYVGFAINATWPAGSGKRTYIEWRFLPAPHSWWLHATVPAAEHTLSQEVRYHLLEGHLLVNGQAFGKLPADIRDSELLNELFGNQRLVAFPSNLPGMTYMLANEKEGHHVHLGYRQRKLVIRALKLDQVLELVPRQIFGSGREMDLPSSWTERCVHWIDIDSKVLEIRRHPRIWKKSSSTLDLTSRRAQHRQAFLVDPHSRLFQTVAQIFHRFEEPHMLTVIQPFHGSLCVELKRMDLTFHVNRKRLLQCQQLFAEVDPDQDPGTAYGLQSMIVLRNVFNRLQRSLITTMGNIQYHRHHMHVLVFIENTGSYARYSIDDVLRQLISPPEPRLLYHKAQIHAFTSCFIRDPLTGRTGTEEALSSLQSGICKPWAPLSAGTIDILLRISSLTPRREYYPKTQKLQQFAHWDPDLTISIQHDSYEPVVSGLIFKSEQLALFHLDAANPSVAPRSTEPHLQERSRWRRSLFERNGTPNTSIDLPRDAPYIARDRWCISKRTSNVREIAFLLHRRPSKLRATENLLKILQKSPIIGGYTGSLSGSLQECLSIDLALEWGSLVQLCRDCRTDNIAKVLFQLGLRAFGKGVNMTVLRVIVSFALFDDLQVLAYPPFPSFTDIREGEKPSADNILIRIIPFCRPYQGLRGKRSRNVSKQAQKDAKEQYDLACTHECQKFADHLVKQWPSSAPSVDGFHLTYLDIEKAMEAISFEWIRMYENLQLSDHIKEVQAVLNDHWAHMNDVPPEHVLSEYQEQDDQPILDYQMPHASQLLQKPGSRLMLHYDPSSLERWMDGKLAVLAQILQEQETYTTPEVAELEHIISSFVSSSCPVRSRYGGDLRESISALKRAQSKTVAAVKMLELDFVEEVKWYNGEIKKARMTVDRHFSQITESLARGEVGYSWLEAGNLWPVLTPTSVLEHLRSTSQCVFGSDMKGALLDYGMEIVKLQQLIRMKEALGKQDNGKLCQEYTNWRGGNWSPSTYPDWLLLEIDSNMKIRPEQVKVAQEIITPRSGSNSVLQMNMGQGKTSMIIPMVACLLADTQMLTRVIVPRALLSQTAQVLQAWLGDMLSKEITHVPFSRRTPTSSSHVKACRKLHEDILHGAGVILEIPENVLSFRLSGLQRLSDFKLAEAAHMIEVQRWKDRICRDILDECDVTLAVKTQLVYPGGSQLALDGNPDRWEVIITVLNLIARELPSLARDFPRSIDIVERKNEGFPIAYFLKLDVELELVRKLVEIICSGQTWILPSHGCPRQTRENLRSIISCRGVEAQTVTSFLEDFPGNPKVRKVVYLLRGLFAHGILLLALKKRWNVQYGLHPDRYPIAVPFHAKGVPSDQAEWGHPDVSILLTCLAFYHQGLSEGQLRQSLQAVLSSDDPAMEYDRWTQSSVTLPDRLRHWNLINMDDKEQVTEIWRHLRWITTVINHYLRRFVFPAHAQQFRVKLQASGWDVPLFQTRSTSSNPGEFKGPGLTTGFSGTNDNRRLLPLTMQQHDLPALLHTNAEVLTYFLHARSRQYIQAIDLAGKRLSEVGLLRRLNDNKIRVLLDAGAFILEMDNRTLVRTWLQENEQAQAAVYFGTDNKPWVQYQTGKTIPLLATPFADNMKNCLVYLDEAHTRGTDLKLPQDARGALTLGLNQTKDHTVQAAMRLRQLGTTQSVTFIASSEVHQSIQDVCDKSVGENLNSADVITWLLDQTCATNRQLHSLYFWQGNDFCYRMQAAATFNDFLSNMDHRKAYLNYLQQPEQRTLEQLYGPRILRGDDIASQSERNLQLFGKFRKFVDVLGEKYHPSTSDRESVVPSAFEEVEQEREVANEAEQERKLQRPSFIHALEFPGLHQAIQDFVETGFLSGDDVCPQACTVITSTRLWKKQMSQSFSLISHVFLSPEFARTVRLGTEHESDNFMLYIDIYQIS
ncbi:unnamed protein product [Penicillium salamii]|nr:unnamed protein product [Penicillium salamii]CAG7958862.1 unnamed protein product [Penicillium salamii]